MDSSNTNGLSSTRQSTTFQSSPRLSSFHSTKMADGRGRNEPSNTDHRSASITSDSTHYGGKDSPVNFNMGFGESQALAIPGSSNRINHFSSSPILPSTSPSPSITSSGAAHYNNGSSQNLPTGVSRFNLASSSSTSLYGVSPSNNNQIGSHNTPHARSSGSDHSRHSSGYASSVGAGGANTFANGFNVFGSTSSHSVAGSGTSLGAEGGGAGGNGFLPSSLPNGKANNVSVNSLASALARSNLSDQALAIHMAASSSHGSAVAESTQSHGGMDPSNSLSRPALLRQSFSDGSPFSGAPDSPAPSQMSSSSSSNLQIPVSLPTTGPLSAADPRTQLHVSNLPYRVRWQDLKDLFRKAGTVLRADVSLTPDNRSRGFGTVLMSSEDDAVRACDMFRGFNWQGRTLDVKIDRSGTLLGIGGVATPLPGLTSPAAMAMFGNPSPTPSPLGNLPTVSNKQQLQASMSHQAGQLPSGISPALYPFLGASNRASIGAAPSSHLQQYTNLPISSGPSLVQQRSSSLSAGVPNIGSNSISPSTMSFGSGPVQQLPFQNQQIVFSPAQSFQQQNFFPTMQQQQQQQPYRMSPMQHSMAEAGPPPPNQRISSPFVIPNTNTAAYLPSSLPQQPPPNSYYGRVLFVGNLPFHCQWQDLKDLFRAAGNIQRADVALNPEGKSRGFGTVLFNTAEDAQNAVRIYHGYEYSGRTLKVHFDRFAQIAAPASGAPPATAAQYTGAFAAANTPTSVSSSSATQSQQQQQQQQRQSSQHKFAQQMQQYQLATDNQPYVNPTLPNLVSRYAVGVDGNEELGSMSQQITSSAYNHMHDPMHESSSSSSSNNFKSASNQRPDRISLPPHGGFNQGMGQFSPLSLKMGGIPMTPGMPGFTFQAVPQTSPTYPQFLSPGLHGPLSPSMGSPLYGPATPGASSSAFNPHINHAPGAPIHFSNGMTTPISNVMSVPPGYNPMFPPMGLNYSALPPVVQQQQQSNAQRHALPQTPHWSQPRVNLNQSKVSKKGEDQRDQQEKKEASTLEEGNLISKKESQGEDVSFQEATVDKGEEGYPFPLVQPFSSALLQRRASTNSPAVTPFNGPSDTFTLLPKSPGWDQRRNSLALNMSSANEKERSLATKVGIRQIQASTGASNTEELARKIAQMSAQKALRQKGLEKNQDVNVSHISSRRDSEASTSQRGEVEDPASSKNDST